ncbi:cytochrome c [Thalassococcus sp. BH17M4-6]|uniref:cytochrome c n=1 Tax=Thalassococcus sp. BH17M4-6 TaxID=3413148 RepID=UPI003BE9383A
MRALTTGLCLTLCISLPAFAQEGGGDQKDQSLKDRGAYLVNMAGCSHCHTAAEDKPFAGGVALQTPFGTLVAPNITPHETGIGGWTQEEFTRALREGKNQDGEPLYPAMPYEAFTKMSDEDVAAVWAYISTVEPVDNAVETVQLPFPYNVRPAVLVWQEMFFEPGRFEPDPARDDETNRGAYLVEAFAHCSSCHTPRNALGAQIASQKFQGGAAEQWYAPDISKGPDSVLTKWSDQDLIAFLSDEHSRNIPSFGPMSQMTNSLSKARPEDVAAIAKYMLTAQPEVDETEPTDPAPLDPDVATLGASVFASNCQSCHTETGEGTPGVAASLVANGGVVARSPNNVISVLLQGIAPNESYGVMPSFADKLSDEEIAAVANHVRRSWGNEGIEVATPSRVASLRALNAEPDGAVDLAVNCRSVADDAVTPDLAAALSKRVEDGTEGASGLEEMANAYADARPEMTRGERLVAMGAIYCRELAIANPDMTRDRFISSNLSFVEDLGKALRDRPRN